MDKDPFREYIRQGEPDKRAKSLAWSNAIGLQDVDGLKTSQYLRSLGFEADDDIFAENSWYFRNALVRANYNDLKKNIHQTTKCLELFLRDMLLNEHNELRSRELHINGALNS